MYRQFNIQQFHVLPTQLYLLCVLCGSEDKQRLSPSHLVSRTVCCHAGISSPICVFTYIYCTHARTHKCTAHLYRSVSLQRNFSRTSGHIKIMYGYVNVKQDVCVWHWRLYLFCTVFHIYSKFAPRRFGQSSSVSECSYLQLQPRW